ncbi:MAG TPA: hypothetical protein VGS41_07675, partial [Chthonomonadales bacterium]|nr:hypothetical protein [Chthonomonadales bacterium]
MKRTRAIAVTLPAALLIWGCGSGGGPATGGDPLVQGRDALNQLASGQQPANPQTLQAAFNDFNLAAQQNPNSSAARFGAAVTLVGLVAQGIDGGSSGSAGANGGTVGGGSAGAGVGTIGSGMVLPTVPPNISTPLPAQPVPAGIVVTPPAPPGLTGAPKPIPPQYSLGLIWNLDGSLSNPLSLLMDLAPITDLQNGLMPFAGYVGDNADVARREKMLSDLATAVGDLQAVEADPNFSTTLPDPSGSGAQLTVGLPEVYLFDAFVHSMEVELALSLAYVRDTGTSAPAPLPGPVSVALQSSGAVGAAMAPGESGSSFFASLDKDHDGMLTPAEYLPPSPFLTLRSASFLATAQQAMTACATLEEKGIEGVFARPAGGSYLAPNSSEIHQELAQIQTTVVPVIKQAALGPVTVQVPVPGVMGGGGIEAVSNGAAKAVPAHARYVFSPPMIPAPIPGGTGGATSESVTIDLAAWFAKPPADLKVFAPTYYLNSSGLPDPA